MKKGKKVEKPGVSGGPETGFLEKGAVVLAKYRKDPPWPALVSNVDWKKKQATVTWILNSSDHDFRRKFKMPFKRLTKFDAEMEEEEPALLEAMEGAKKLQAVPVEKRIAGQNSPDGIFARVKKSFPVKKAKKRAANWEYRIEKDGENVQLCCKSEIKKPKHSDINGNGSTDVQNDGDMYSAVKSRKKRDRVPDTPESAEPVEEKEEVGEDNLSSGLWKHEIIHQADTASQPQTSTFQPCKSTQNEIDEWKQNVKDPNLETEAEEDVSGPKKSHTTPVPRLKHKGSGSCFRRGDVVWIKYGKWEWWPSVIMNVQPPKKRVTFLYLALPSNSATKPPQRFSVGYKNVHNFKDFYHTHYTSSQNMDLLDAIDQADEIINGKCDPFEYMNKSSSVASTSDGVKVEKEKEAEKGGAEEEDSDDLAGKMDVEGDLEDEDSPQRFSPETNIAIEDRKEKNRELINLIVSNDTKVLLEKIYRKEIGNVRQEVWDSEPSMNPPTSFGPIVDEEQIEELVQILSLWFQAVNPEASVRNTFSYIICVWLPEAVKHGLSKKHKCSLDEAEKMLESEMMAACLTQEVEAVQNEIIAHKHQNHLDAIASSSSGSAFEQLVAVACQEREKTKSPPMQSPFRLNCTLQK